MIISLHDHAGVLNGLLSRDNQKEALSIPIGIIPAGSDNSLVWTIGVNLFACHEALQINKDWDPFKLKTSIVVRSPKSYFSKVN